MLKFLRIFVIISLIQFCPIISSLVSVDVYANVFANQTDATVTSNTRDYNSDYLWVPCYGDNTVYKVNVNTHEVEAIIPVGEGPAGSTVGGEHVLITHRWSPYLYRISKEDNIVVDSINLGSAMAFSVCAAIGPRRNIYVVGHANLINYNYDIARFTKISPDGSLLGTCDLAYTPGFGEMPEEAMYRSLGVAVNRDGIAIIPNSCAWLGQTKIAILNTSDLTYDTFTYSAYSNGYCRVGALFTKDNIFWGASERGGSAHDFYKYSNIEGFIFHQVSPDHLGSYRGLTIDSLGNIWCGTDEGILIKHIPDLDSSEYYDIGDEIGGLTIDRHGYLWATLPSEDKIMKFDLYGNQIGDVVYVGSRPHGYGDMSGYEFSFMYLCGDFDDNGHVDILDILFLIKYKSKDGPAPDPMESADVNSDTNIDLLDIIYLIQYKYKAGPEPNCP